MKTARAFPSFLLLMSCSVQTYKIYNARIILYLSFSCSTRPSLPPILHPSRNSPPPRQPNSPNLACPFPQALDSQTSPVNLSTTTTPAPELLRGTTPNLPTQPRLSKLSPVLHPLLDFTTLHDWLPSYLRTTFLLATSMFIICIPQGVCLLLDFNLPRCLLGVYNCACYAFDVFLVSTACVYCVRVFSAQKIVAVGCSERLTDMA